VISTLRRLNAIAQPPFGRLALALALGAGAVVCGIGLMSAAGYLISRAAEQPPILSLSVTIVVVRFFGLTRPIARYFERLSAHDAALRILGRIRAGVYERIEPLAPVQLEGYRSGELLGRMVGDVDGIQSLYVRGLAPPAVGFVAGAASVVVAAWILPAAGAVLAGGLILVGIAIPLLSAALVRATARRQGAARSELTADLVELLHGAPELAAYGHEETALARVREADGVLARIGRRDALATGLGDSLSILVVGLTVTGVLAVAISAHANGALNRVFIATLALLALAAFDGALPVAPALRELSTALASAGRVLELTDRKPAVSDPPSPLPPPPDAAIVELAGVTARYGNADAPVLESFDLRLEPGRRVALVGPSGAGKTTVTNLLLRFLDPEKGRVTLAGRDLRDYQQEDVRSLFALAGQDAHLFNSTIRANLALARPDASEEALWDALGRARIADWVASLPDGLETLVGESGKEISGGQRQRLVLARALLREAPVLLLDEPTAHLDDANAEALVQDILAASDGRAVLLITHRPEGLGLVDEIVELVPGRRGSAPSTAEVHPGERASVAHLP
jgi:thiol reductant ABC exporter CydC subunit